MKRKLIYICSPFRAHETDAAKAELEMKKNLNVARQACGIVMNQGNLPIAPHLYFPQFLDDGNEKTRNYGINAGLELLENCDELWVIGERITEGMAREIGKAGRLGLPIRHVSSPDQMDNVLLSIIMRG